MSEPVDMEHPVTRHELREELGRYPTREELDRKFDLWAGALVARLTALESQMITLRVDLVEEMGRQTRAAMEWALGQFRAVDDRYADLPDRVRRLEQKVFPPKRARRR